MVGSAGGREDPAPSPPLHDLALCARSSVPPGRSSIPILYDVNTRLHLTVVMASRDLLSNRRNALIINKTLFPAFMSF